MNYFVTGLPRSRTAWFAEWLPNCQHEAMEGCYTRTEYINKVGDGGDSSCGIPFLPIHDYFPGAPVLIVHRDLDEVIWSLEKLGLYNAKAHEVLLETLRRLNKMEGMRVYYQKLDLEEIWNYLIGPGYDEKTTKELAAMNIQHVNHSPDAKALKSLIGEY